MSSLGFCPFNIKVGADLNLGHLKDPRLLPPHSSRALPLGQILLPRKELLLQLFHRRCIQQTVMINIASKSKSIYL
jgi:hypothetical protein